MKTEDRIGMAFAALMIVALLSGCTAIRSTGIGSKGGVLGTGIGDLRVSDTERVALNAARPGLGDMLAGFAGKGEDGERVPTGYSIRWRAYLGGVEINEAYIVRRPELVASPGVPAAVVVVSNAPPADPPPLSSTNQADDVATVVVTNSPAKPRPAVPGID